MIAVLTRGKSPKNMIRKGEGRKVEDSILKEKKFEYRAYVQLFFILIIWKSLNYK